MVGFDPQRIVPDESKSLSGGAICRGARGDRGVRTRCAFERVRHKSTSVREAAEKGARYCSAARKGLRLIPNLRRRYEDGSWAGRRAGAVPLAASCPTCRGQRLKRQSLSVKVKGRTISDYVNLPISEALDVVDGLQLTDREAIIAERILKEIQERLRFLNDVGVGYLTLGRSAATLSGGEGQRIRLATPLGANSPAGVCPRRTPIGLHPRDTELLRRRRGCDLGNTVIVAQHDEETILGRTT